MAGSIRHPRTIDGDERRFYFADNVIFNPQVDLVEAGR